MTLLHQPSLFSSQWTEAESRSCFTPAGSRDPCFPRRGTQSPAGTPVLCSGASISPQLFNPYRQTADPQGWFLLTPLLRRSMSLKEKERGGGEDWCSKEKKKTTEKKNEEKDKRHKKRKKVTGQKSASLQQQQKSNPISNREVSRLNFSVWSPLLIGHLEKGIMGRGATGRVEEDLQITHSICFNLLGGADGWSSAVQTGNIRRREFQQSGGCIWCVWERERWSDWFCNSYTRRWKDDKRGRKHERTTKSCTKEKSPEEKTLNISGSKCVKIRWKRKKRTKTGGTWDRPRDKRQQ